MTGTRKTLSARGGAEGAGKRVQTEKRSGVINFKFRKLCVIQTVQELRFLRVSVSPREFDLMLDMGKA